MQFDVRIVSSDDFKTCKASIYTNFSLPSFAYGNLLFLKSGGLFGALDANTGEIKIPFVYKNIIVSLNGIIVARNEEHYYFYKPNGDFITYYSSEVEVNQNAKAVIISNLQYEECGNVIMSDGTIHEYIGEIEKQDIIEENYKYVQIPVIYSKIALNEGKEIELSFMKLKVEDNILRSRLSNNQYEEAFFCKADECVVLENGRIYFFENDLLYWFNTSNNFYEHFKLKCIGKNRRIISDIYSKDFIDESKICFSHSGETYIVAPGQLFLEISVDEYSLLKPAVSIEDAKKCEAGLKKELLQILFRHALATH